MIDNASKPRLVLEQHEAAYVLRISENDVRNRLRRGALKGTPLGQRMCVDADDVVRRIADDDLALLILRRLMEGRLTAPRNWDPAVPAPDVLASLTGLNDSFESLSDSTDRRHFGCSFGARAQRVGVGA